MAGNYRWIGGFLLFIGAFAAYAGIYTPFTEADLRHKTISIPTEIVIICPIAIVLRVIYLALGDDAEKLIGTPHHRTPIGLVIIFSFIALGLGLNFWLSAILAGMGYKYSREHLLPTR